MTPSTPALVLDFEEIHRRDTLRFSPLNFPSIYFYCFPLRFDECVSVILGQGTMFLVRSLRWYKPQKRRFEWRRKSPLVGESVAKALRGHSVKKRRDSPKILSHLHLPNRPRQTKLTITQVQNLFWLQGFGERKQLPKKHSCKSLLTVVLYTKI